MHLPGGPIDKFGNYYENQWTVYCMIDLLEEKADILRLEPPKEHGFEFYLVKDGKVQFHQVKTGPRWNISRLLRESVLPNFMEKLSNPDHECHLITNEGASDLFKLSGRARGAKDFPEFKAAFLSDQSSSADFSAIYNKFKEQCTEEELYERLKRIFVSTRDDRSLHQHIRDRLTPLIEGDPGNAVDILAQYAFENIYQEISGYELWEHLRNRQFQARSWPHDPTIAQSIQDQTKRFIQGLQITSINGILISREECEQIEKQLPDNKVLFVSGTAGIGKSHVLGQIAEQYQCKGWPVLALRLDRIASDVSAEEVWSQVGLPGSPVQVLASIAKEQDCLLIVDQLDVISQASGRSVQFFERIEDLLRQAQNYPNLKIIFGCRRFDIEYDPNLKKLVKNNNEIMVQLLSKEAIIPILHSLKIDASRLSHKQWSLLALPLHLGLLAEVVEDIQEPALSFESANELFDLYWQRKAQKLAGTNWIEVINRMCDQMSNRQMLFVPDSVLDSYIETASKMTSENILDYQNGRYSFFHESFFDYAFARQFTASNQTLIDLLLSNGQGLFRRAQVRQILTFMRDRDFDAYCHTVESLLASPEIRFHIKEVVFGFLQNVSQPTNDEWLLFSKYLFNPEQTALSREATRVLRLSSAWFEFIDAQGILRRWLTNTQDKTKSSEALDLISIHQHQYPEHVSELLEPLLEEPKNWNNKVVSVLSYADFGSNRRFFDLLLKLIDIGALDNINRFSISFRKLPETQPMWACELIGHFLRRRLTICKQAKDFSTLNKILEEQTFIEDVVVPSAQNAPSQFVSEVLPFILEAVQCVSKESTENDEPLTDSIWYYPMEGAHRLADKLLFSAGKALMVIAEQEPDEARKLLQSLKASQFHTIQFLLYQGYRGNPAFFADEAADYLISHPAKFHTGYSSDTYWATVELIQAISPYLDESRLASLSEVILNYYPRWEKSHQAHEGPSLYPSPFGLAQYKLLYAIAPKKRSCKVIKRLQEWGRKFSPRAIEPPTGIISGMVESPIPRDIVKRMSDREWLKAMRKYPDDERNRWGRDFLKGAAIELSRELGILTKEDPTRFANLLLQLPEDINLNYFKEILRGIKDSPTELSLEIVTTLLLRVHALPSRPCGREICDLISRYAAMELPKDLLEIAAWYATEDPHPETEVWDEEAPSGHRYYRGDIITAGLNSVRGNACDTLGDLIWKDPNHISFFLPTLERIVRDPMIAVRAFAARPLIAVLKNDRELAISLLQELVKTDDVLLATSFVEQLIAYLLHTHLEELHSLVERMLQSEDEGARTAGGRFATRALLIEGNNNRFSTFAPNDSKAHRKGYAQIIVGALPVPELHTICSEKLIPLFHDDVQEIRSIAAGAFRRLSDEQLEAGQALIRAFLGSPAFSENSDDLIYELNNRPIHFPEIICELCEAFLDVSGAAADISTVSAATASIVNKILIKLYSQSRNREIKKRCLDLIDRLMAIGTYNMSTEIDKLDRLI
jgi:hypothetical protein